MDPEPEANSIRTTATSKAEGRLVVDASANLRKKKRESLQARVKKMSSAPEN